MGWMRWSPVSYKYRQLNSIDFTVFQNNILLSSLFTSPAETAETFATHLRDFISSEFDKLAPLKTVTRKSGGKPINRFMSKEANEAKRMRRRLERRWKRTSDESDRSTYRCHCRLTNQLINESRRVYYAERIGDITVDSKKRWNVVKKLLHGTDRSSPLSKNKAQQRRNSISTYFVDKIRRLKDVTETRLAGIIRSPFSSDRPHSGALLNNLPCVTDEEVRKLIGTIPSKSSPMDFVPTSVLKQCSPVFISLVTRLANLSFTEGIFPSMFKTAQITPLLKKEGLDSSDPSNYRPISNLNTISKIIERLALNRLCNT